MMSVLPNGGSTEALAPMHMEAALDDVSATEWRFSHPFLRGGRGKAALDDVSATEWRCDSTDCALWVFPLHSMMSVLPNGGFGADASLGNVDSCTR